MINVSNGHKFKGDNKSSRTERQSHFSGSNVFPMDSYKRKLPKTFFQVEPKTAISWDFKTSLDNLSKVVGRGKLNAVLKGKTIDGPMAKETNGEWLKNSKIIGVNPRAIGNYWDIVKYAMTFPEESIHFLPLFEQGCAGSLYAPINFQLSDQFMDKNLTKIGFNTPEKQLKLVVNVLHSLDKNIGMDFVQHSDRFSEDVFVHPEYFEWVKLNQDKTAQLFHPDVNCDEIHKGVEDTIINFIRKNGDAQGNKLDIKKLNELFSSSVSEAERLKILFGNQSKASKDLRRYELMQTLRGFGYETISTPINTPVRPILFEKMETDGKETWASFKQPKADGYQNGFFGNLTPYKLYHLNPDGSLNTNKPNQKVWDYLGKKVSEFQKEYNFDFLRADMGYIDYNDKARDLNATIKNTVKEKNKVSHFASFGECFFSEDLEKTDVLKNKNYDAILGDIQYKPVDGDFINIVKRYNLNQNHKISISSITADSDCKPFNNLYDNLSNKVRTFAGFFLNQPSYMGMGLETKDVNANAEKFFTRNYINDNGLRPYEWGKNHEFFNTLLGIRKIYAKIGVELKTKLHCWLNTNNSDVGSWLYYSKKDKTPSYLFVMNTARVKKENLEIENPLDMPFFKNELQNHRLGIRNIFSTDKSPKKIVAQIIYKNNPIKITNLAPGEGRIYKIIKNSHLLKRI